MDSAIPETLICNMSLQLYEPIFLSHHFASQIELSFCFLKLKEL